MENRKCDECNMAPANIHLTQIVQDEMSVLHLCEDCAKKKGISIVIQDEQQDTLAQVPSKPVEKTVEEKKSDDQEVPQITCPSCFMTFAEFKKQGWLGCTACYRSFEKEIGELLVQVHGSAQHKGKVYDKSCDKVAVSEDMHVLRSELAHAIKSEKFELAALIRDKINSVSDNKPPHNKQE